MTSPACVSFVLACFSLVSSLASSSVFFEYPTQELLDLVLHSPSFGLDVGESVDGCVALWRLGVPDVPASIETLCETASDDLSRAQEVLLRCRGHENVKQDLIDDLIDTITQTKNDAERLQLLFELVSLSSSSFDLSSLTSSVDDLLSRSLSSGKYSFFPPLSPLVAAAKLAVVAFHFHQQHDTPLEPKFINAFSSLFASNVNAIGTSEVASLVLLSRLLTENPVHQPLLTELLGRTAVEPSGQLKLKVANVMGAPLHNTSVKLQSVKSHAGIDILSGGVQLSASSEQDAVFEWLVPASTPAGIYKAKLRISSDKSMGKLSHFSFKVLGSAAFSSAEAFISLRKSGSDVSEREELAYPAQLGSELDVPLGRSFVQLIVSVSGNVKPVHALLLLTPHTTEAGAEATTKPIVFLLQNEADNSYKLSLAVSKIGANGLYDVDLLLSDPLLYSELRWSLGSLNLHVPAASVKAPRQRPMVSVALDEINHEFHGESPRPSTLVAAVFVVLLLLVSLALLIAWFHFGLSLSLPNVWSNPFAVFFQSSLLALLLLFATYWLQLTFMAALRGSLLVGVLLLFTGHRALSEHARMRVQRLSSAKKEL